MAVMGLRQRCLNTSPTTKPLHYKYILNIVETLVKLHKVLVNVETVSGGGIGNNNILVVQRCTCELTVVWSGFSGNFMIIRKWSKFGN